MGQGIWLAVILALILQWVFGLNFWTAVIIAVIAAPILGAILQSIFGSKTVQAPQAGQETQNPEEGKAQPPEEDK